MNPTISADKFADIHPEGETALIEWQEELKGLIGEEHYNEYISTYTELASKKNENPHDYDALLKYEAFKEEQEKTGRLNDVQIMRDNLLQNMEQ